MKYTFEEYFNETETKKRCIEKIRDTSDYIINNPCSYTTDDDEFEDAEDEFFYHGGCECYVRIGDRFIHLIANTKKEDAEFVKNNINNIDYFYVVNEEFDNVVGDIDSHFNKFNFCDDIVRSYEYEIAITSLNGKFTVDDMNKYFIQKFGDAK